MRHIAVLALVLVLTACGSAPAAAVPTSPPVEPTAAPTAISLADVDLEPLLITSGDLPADLTGGQIRDVAPKMFDGIPKAVQLREQRFARGGDAAGGVVVFLYENAGDRDAGYARVLDGMGETTPVDGLGDQSAQAAADAAALRAGIAYSDVLFRRCAALVHIRVGSPDVTSPDEVVITAATYAKRLDKRLQSVVCG